MSEYPEPLRDDADSTSGSFLPVIMAVFIDLLGFGIILPALPYLVEAFPVSEQATRLGWIISAYSIAQFIFSPIWGRVSDKVGRRPVILVGVGGSVLAFLSFGLTTDYSLIVASRAIAGFFTAATLPTARAYIADITPPEKRAKRFGLLGAAFGLGFTLGPAIGGLFASIPGDVPVHFYPSVFAATLSLVNLYVALRNLPESLQKSERVTRNSVAQSLRRFFGFFAFPGVFALILIFGVNTYTFSGFEAVFSLYIKEVIIPGAEPYILGLFFLYVGVWGIIVQGGLIGKIVEKLGEEKTILLGLLVVAIGFLTSSRSTGNPWIFGLALSPLAIGIGLINPPLNSALSRRIPKDMQGGGLGINSSVGSLGRIFGPLGAGVIVDSLGFGLAFDLAAVVVLGILVFAAFSVNPSQVSE